MTIVQCKIHTNTDSYTSMIFLRHVIIYVYVPEESKKKTCVYFLKILFFFIYTLSEDSLLTVLRYL